MLPSHFNSPRLAFRAYRPDDFDAFAALNADPQVRLHMGGVITREDAARRFQTFMGDGGFPGNAWAVVQRDSGSYIGHCWLLRIEEVQDLELGLQIVRSHWQKGFGSEVVAAMLAHAKASQDHGRVVATVDPDHRASIRVLEKAGMQLACERRDEEGVYLEYACSWGTPQPARMDPKESNSDRRRSDSTGIRLVAADPVTHREIMLKLNVEYMQWNSEQLAAQFGIRFADVAGADVPEYVARHIDKACGAPPPNGCFYLVEYQGQVAGMGGMRRIHGDVSELKRVYVRPAFRGKQLGAAVLQRVLADARAFGFKSMRLDSGPFMVAAHRLYRAHGFVDRSPYPEAEVGEALHSRWHFMERHI